MNYTIDHQVAYPVINSALDQQRHMQIEPLHPPLPNQLPSLSQVLGNMLISNKQVTPITQLDYYPRLTVQPNGYHTAFPTALRSPYDPTTMRAWPNSLFPNAMPSSAPLSFISHQDPSLKKRPRRRHHEVERLYQCNFPRCPKAYGTLNHLNAHVLSQNHGPKRLPAEFKEIRKLWKAKKEKAAAAAAAAAAACNSQQMVAQQAAVHHV
jgi:hypothetical protein